MDKRFFGAFFGGLCLQSALIEMIKGNTFFAIIMAVISVMNIASYYVAKAEEEENGRRTKSEDGDQK
jgi:hypothetical protein